MSKKNGRGGPAGDYAVGYGRPPSANQFKPGQSGNPFGRRAKPKPDDPSGEGIARSSHGGTDLDRLIQAELNRPVDAQENGQPVKLSVIQAAIRSMGLSAMKGRTHAQRAIVQLANAASEKELERREQARHFVNNYRRCYPRAVNEFKAINPGKLCYLPHPDDVFFNDEEGIVDFKGPFTEAAWHLMNVDDFVCKWIFIAIQDLLFFFAEGRFTANLCLEIQDLATGLYNAAEKIRQRLPERLHAGIDEVKPKEWVPSPNEKDVDLIYFGVLSPVSPGLLRMLEAEPGAYELFSACMARLNFSHKGIGVNRTRHCISAFGDKLTSVQRSHALAAVTGNKKPAAMTRDLWELARKMIMPAHILCEARFSAAQIYQGREIIEVIRGFREAVDAG
jgi:hypothetical protein